ncbi:MAG TPA: hypothetical protein DEQ02_04140 [Ruminococcaceae bacterium]|nr:hypothetical protein [Oscillospiraceae bacterium]
MSKIRFKNTKAGGFFAKRGFYIALAVCLVAIGGAAWTAMNTIGKAPDPIDFPSDTFIDYESYVEDGTAEVDNPVSDIPAEPESREESSQPESKTAHMPNESERYTPPEDKEPVKAFYVVPVSGNVTKIFNDSELQYSATYDDWRLHEGIDIEAAKGSMVVSVAEGVVTDIFNDPLMGNTVVIEHGGGITAYYSGLDDNIRVAKGGTVDASTEVGSIGIVPCEALDEPHLHFAMKKGDDWVSPLEVMGMLNTD